MRFAVFAVGMMTGRTTLTLIRFGEAQTTSIHLLRPARIFATIITSMT